VGVSPVRVRAPSPAFVFSGTFRRETGDPRSRVSGPDPRVVSRLLALETAEIHSGSVTDTNGIVADVHTANVRAVRGYTLVAAIADEVADARPFACRQKT
jgi:hypothetical protein